MQNSVKPIRIYSDKQLSSQPYPALLQSIWGKQIEDPDDPLTGRFDCFNQEGSKYFVEACIDNCDFGILPFDYGLVIDNRVSSDNIWNFVDKLHQHGKKTLVFCWHDRDPYLRDDRIIIFQTAFDPKNRRNCSQLKQKINILPCFTEDFVERYCDSVVPVRGWKSIPVVGFCGRADNAIETPFVAFRSWLRRIKFQHQNGYQNYPYRQLRTRCINIIQKDNNVRANFDVKGGFYGRSVDSSKTVGASEKKAARSGYVQNMKSSDYILCVRGAGNFSIRFYETLSLGRIPVYIDTGAPLPFERKIDWDRYLVRVFPKSIKKLPDKIISFHNLYRGAAFVKIQENIRQIWLDFFEPGAFFRQLSYFLRHSL